MSLLFDVAKKYARKGLKVVPVMLGGKNPIIQDWVNNASSDPEMLGHWFENNELNIGIVTGKTSNIVVIDIDIKNGDGRLSVADFEGKTGAYLPETVTAKTQNGGLHLFFRYPSGIENIKGRVGILPNVDIRADGNQVVVYPSKGEKGEYTWIRSPWEYNIATLPKVWKQFICGEVDSADLNKIKVLRKPFKLPDTAPSGMRHATLLSYAGSLATKSGIGKRELAGAVREANRTICHPPIENESELENIIEWATERIGKKEVSIDANLPEWVFVTDKGTQIIDDGLFVASFKKDRELVCINGVFYDEDGYVEANGIKSDIQNMIKNFVTTSLSTKVNTLFDSLKNECFFQPPAPKHNIVNLNNMALKVDETGIYEAAGSFTLNRLSVNYNPSAKCPRWNHFLHGLLEKEDITTLQEYVGYCLVPTTIAQKALIMVGKGGEGKSVVGEVLQALFKTSMVQGELHKLQENRFLMAQLENKLVFYDDDLQSGALTDTGTFKKLVTATIPVLVERKGEPHYEMLPYARILASGNKSLEACYDHSDGFYRRLILLRCKDKPEGRRDDKLLAKKIILDELEGILNWALVGLQRLMGNEWEFTLSAKTLVTLQEAQEDGNSLIPFLHDETAVVYGEDESVTSADLYDTYSDWCEGNALKPLAMRTVATYLKENASFLNIGYSNRVDGKRGYTGIGLVTKVKRAGKFIISRAKEA